MTDLDGQQVGTSPVAPVNDPEHKNSQGLNSFDLTHYNALTARFGDVTPFLSFETAPRDSVRFANNHELRTLTLAAPLLSPVRIHKSYFHTPLKAIMPNTWDLIIRNPKTGSDVPDYAKPSYNIYRIYYEVLTKLTTFLKSLIAGTLNMDDVTIDHLRLIAMARNVMGKGSLLRLFKYPYFWDKNVPEFDILFDNLMSSMFDVSKYGNDKFELRFFLSNSGNPDIDILVESGAPAVPLVGVNSVADMLNVLDDFDGTFANASDTNTFPSAVTLKIDEFCDWIDIITDELANYAFSSNYEELNVNFCPLFAYHMACAQFFSNDNVDNVDNSRVWLDNYRSLINYNNSFTLNGITRYYDLPSNVCFSDLMSDYGQVSGRLKALLNLFSFERSLKYGDYFIGSRTRPLAVGDVQIDVLNDGSGYYVEALDVTKNLAMQKFLNAVNKLSQNIKQYTKGIFGISSISEPCPQFIARSTSFIGNPETVNTGDDQGYITSQLSSIDGKYEFNAQFEDFGYLMGFVTFDVIPCYSCASDRNLLHIDRFSFFNPMLQNIGDQKVFQTEENSYADNVNQTFGYQQRYAEYKNAISHCSGNFALVPQFGKQGYYGLSNWLYQAEPVERPIDSRFVRHRRVDFDRFYSEIDGVSLSTYIHFAIVFNQQLTANRAMQYQSTIL